MTPRPTHAQPAPRSRKWLWLLLGAAIALGGAAWAGSSVASDRRKARTCVTEKAVLKTSLTAGDLKEARAALSDAWHACGLEDQEIPTMSRELAAKEAAAKALQDGEEKRHADGAARVWLAYDNLPSKTTERLLEAAKEAKTHELGLPPEATARVARSNAANARRRMAPLINPEARTKGDEADILVPSETRAKCVLWGSQWSTDTESLKFLGFKKIMCPASSYTSKLTGEQVVEPAQEWLAQ